LAQNIDWHALVLHLVVVIPDGTLVAHSSGVVVLLAVGVLERDSAGA